MHNLKDLRKNLETFKEKFKDRNLNFDIEEFNKLDKANRDLISKKEVLEQEKKSLSKSKEKSNFEKSKKISEQIEKISVEQKKSQKSIQIEHLMGGVKSLVEKMINSKNFKDEHLKIIHEDHTLCCYKLKCETGIDEKLKLNELSEIKLAPKP